MNALRVPQTLGADDHELVAGSPLLLGVLLDRAEHRPGVPSSFCSTFSMGAAMENAWLRPVLDWTSSERRHLSQYVFQEDCATPQLGWDGPPDERLPTPGPAPRP